MSTRVQKRLREYLLTEENIDNNENNENNEIDQNESEENDFDENPNKKQRNISIPKLLDGTFYAIVSRDGMKVVARCLKCGKERKGDISSTGNFMEHIKKSHPDIKEKVEQHRKHSSDKQQKKHQKTVRDMLTTFTQDEVYSKLMWKLFTFLNVFYWFFQYFSNSFL